MLTPTKARAILTACNVPAASDFHALTSDQVNSLLAYATEAGYRAPRNANGSRARYWHAYLERLVSRPVSP